jgi:type I restriction enzyme S subunit
MSWEKVRLGDVVFIKTGKLDANASSSNGEYPFFTCSKDPLKISSYSYDTECVLVAGNGDLNVKYFKGKFDAYQRTYIIEVQNENVLLIKYLYYFIDTCLVSLREKSIGGVIKYIKLENLTELLIPLPPLATQKRIADILDTADALRRKDQELLTKYDQLAQAIFIDMFGDPVKNEKGWEVKKLGDCIDFMTSGSRGWAQYYSDEGDVFLRINNVGYNQMKLNDVVYVKPPNSAEAKRTLVSPNDMLLSITADLGRTSIIPESFPKAYINQHLAILRFQKEYQPKFISQLLASEYGKLQFMKLNKGGVKAGLNFDDIKSIEFLNPKISLQKKYIEIIEELQKQINNKIECNSHSTSLFSSLIQQAFNGTLVS